MGHDDCGRASYPDNCEKSCWERLRHFCLCGWIVKTPGVQDGLVGLEEKEVYRIWEKGRTGMTFREFQVALQDEANRASLAAIPYVTQVQTQLGGLGSEQALLTFRICVRVDGVRICVEISL